MTQVTLPWGNEEISFDLPPEWKLEATLMPPGVAPAADPEGAVAEVISAPIGSPPLIELARSAARIAIVVDDSSRPTPAHRMLPPVLKALETAGKKPENITIVFAVATHRPMTTQEMAAKVGADVIEKYPLKIHNAHAPDLVKKGVTGRGTPVYFDSLIDAADLRILVGAVDGHPQAGFGGGYKMLIPGCAGAETVGKNHLIMPSPDKYNLTAMSPENNPMRLDLEEGCAMLSGKNFLINAILTSKGEVGRVVAGDPIAAHRKGIEFLLQAKGVKVEKPFDIVITSSSPMDLDVRQGGKAITSAAFACRPNGLILAALRCYEGMGKDAPPAKFKMPNPKIARGILKILGAWGIYTLTSRALKKIPPEERFFVNITVQLLREFRLLAYSPTVAQQSQGKLAALFYDDIATLIEAARKWMGKGPHRVAVFPKGAGMIVLKG